MQAKYLIFPITLLLLSAFSWEHPLKMSFSKLDIESDGLVKLETRIFLDDLTEHMQQLFRFQQADFSSISASGTQALERYLGEHLYFEQGGNRFKLQITTVSFSRNRIALVVNMKTIDPLDVSQEAFLVNTLLCDASPMQTNDIKYLGEHYLLGMSNPKMKIQLD